MQHVHGGKVSMGAITVREREGMESVERKARGSGRERE
jgi:hypothetical protein